MKINLPALTIVCFCVAFWCAVYIFGFFASVIWTVVVAAVIGIWLRITGRA